MKIHTQKAEIVYAEPDEMTFPYRLPAVVLTTFDPRHVVGMLSNETYQVIEYADPELLPLFENLPATITAHNGEYILDVMSEDGTRLEIYPIELSPEEQESFHKAVHEECTICVGALAVASVN